MPRDGSGVATKPAGTTAVTGTTIGSTPFNNVIDDVYSILNGAQPVSKGGTGGTTPVGAADAILVKGADIASATTTNLAAATGDFVHITGTTTITGLGTAAAGVTRKVVFDSALTLTHNATSLILPGAANITTAAGDTAIFVSEGSGNWRCIAYERGAVTPGGLAIGTPVATSSGTAHDWTGIPAGTKRISINMRNVSLSGSADLLVQLGTISGFETSGYVSTSSADAISQRTSTSGLIALSGGGGVSNTGRMTLELIDSSANAWVDTHMLSRSPTDAYGGGSKALAAVLDRVRVTTTNGADTFDAGTINIMYE